MLHIGISFVGGALLYHLYAVRYGEPSFAWAAFAGALSGLIRLAALGIFGI